jgi:DNA-binding GntR family transcriptional regulator
MNQMLRVPREETSLRQRTTQTLRTAILDGVFAPGQKLSERELCESLDVSRSCLRESLQHLQAEGLITIVPHRGPEVTDISVQEVRDIYEVRASLEGLASRGFALHASEAQRAALRAKLGELAVPGVASDKVALLAIKNQFYDILIEGCGMSQPGRLPQTLAELDAIVAAIEQGDAEKAARLSAEHVQKAGQGVLRAMDGKATPAR